MAYLMMISVPDDVKENLKTIKNKSGLITQLLRDSFNISDKKLTVEDIDQELDRLKDNAHGEQIQKLEEQKIKVLSELEETEKEAQRKKEKLLQQFKMWFLEFFEITEEQAIELSKSFFEKRNTTNIYDFGKSQNLKEKKVEIGE